jgi:hypothetical protein
VADAVDVDQTRMVLRPVADDAAGLPTFEIDRDRHAAHDLVRARAGPAVDDLDQLVLLLEAAHQVVAGRRLAAPDAKLAEPRSLAHQHAECARRDLEYCSGTWSKAVPWSVMRRVKMSSRPVELFGLPIADVRWRRSSASSRGMM